MKKHIHLRYLPYEHPLRNSPLLDLGAEFKHSAWDEFRPIEAGRPLADNSYNTLSRGWQDFYEWRIPNPDAPKETGGLPIPLGTYESQKDK